MSLLQRKDIFIKFWFFFDSILNFYPYVKSVLPGHKEGISASSIAGYNIGINKYIKNEDELKATIKAFKFITSKDIQKEGMKENLMVPGIFSFYEDKELCPTDDCKIFQELQPYKKTVNIYYDIDDYSKQLRDNIYEFIYNNKTSSEVLKNIDDITKIYYISINSENSHSGLAYTILVIFISILMLLSFIFPFKDNFSPFFKFIPLDLWLISIIGSILILCIICTGIGVVTNSKCFHWIFLLNFGLTFNYIPFFYKLISNFPKNNFLIWISKHKYIFFFFFVFIDTLLCLLLIIKPYNIETVIVNEGKNFQKCKLNTTFQFSITNIMVFWKGLIIFTILLFVFLEWNIYSTRYDLKFNIAAIYIDVLSFIIIMVLSKGKIDDYIWNFHSKSTIIMIMSLSNYFFMYGYRLLFSFLNKQNIKLNFINSINKNFIENTDTSNNESRVEHSYYITTQTNEGCIKTDLQARMVDESNTNNTTSINNKDGNNNMHGTKSSLFIKMMSYHNQTDIEIDDVNTFSNHFSITQ